MSRHVNTKNLGAVERLLAVWLGQAVRITTRQEVQAAIEICFWTSTLVLPDLAGLLGKAPIL